MTDKTKPHMIVLNVSLEAHELLPTGECSGNIVSQEELEKAGIKSHFLLSVNGYNKSECIKKLKEKLKDFENG